MGAEDTRWLASQLAEEYGDEALIYAGRAVATYEADGNDDRARLWRVVHAILGDIAACRIDAEAPITIH
jgi:hypothetical protein